MLYNRTRDWIRSTKLCDELCTVSHKSLQLKSFVSKRTVEYFVTEQYFYSRISSLGALRCLESRTYYSATLAHRSTRYQDIMDRPIGILSIGLALSWAITMCHSTSLFWNIGRNRSPRSMKWAYIRCLQKRWGGNGPHHQVARWWRQAIKTG